MNDLQHIRENDISDELRKKYLHPVINNFKSKLEHLKMLRDALNNDDVKKSPHLLQMIKREISKTIQDLEEMKTNLWSYTHYRYTEEDKEIRWLFSEGMECIKYWLEGWGMHAVRYGKYKNTLRAFRAVRSLFPIKNDMKLWRVLSIPKDLDVMSTVTLRAGPRSLQSWTMSKRLATSFYNKQYNGKEVLRVQDNTLSYENSNVYRWAIISAMIPAENILCVPESFVKLMNYYYNDHRFTKRYRVRDSVSEVIYDYSREQEAMVYIPYNLPIKIMSITPLRNEGDDDLETIQ